MYKEFFNLSAEPFRITPDPGFLFLTDQHKEALASIIYGISKRKGFVCIIGEVGVGKTTILRSYLDGAEEPELVFVHIFNPAVSFLALLKQIFAELDLPIPGEDIPSMVEALRVRLIERHQRHETLVLLIDEAQNMPVGTLESLRMLSNLETATEKLVQIVLVGQPELEQLLAERQLRQLESRIAVRTRLGPLSRADSVAYIRHRLKCVALDDRPVFTEGAIRLLVRHAQGIPRRINVLCDSALMTAFGRQVRPANSAIVREVLRDLRIGRRRVGLEPPENWRRSLAFAAGGAGLAAALALVLGGAPSHRPAAAPAAVSLPLPPLRSTAKPAHPAPVPAVVDPEPGLISPAPALPAPVAPPPSAPEPSGAASPPVPAETVAPAGGPASASPPPPAIAPAGDGAPRWVVVRGDTLAQLIARVYGKFDRQHLDWVKAHNPEIVDVDRIQVGQVIAFPGLPPSGEEP